MNKTHISGDKNKILNNLLMSFWTPYSYDLWLKMNIMILPRNKRLDRHIIMNPVVNDFIIYHLFHI